LLTLLTLRGLEAAVSFSNSSTRGRDRKALARLLHHEVDGLARGLARGLAGRHPRS
jgi:hypothetical protein